jgi:hypothetical protein
MFSGSPSFDARVHAPAARAIAARTWQGLLIQEARSRAHSARLVVDLQRLDAPPSILASARRVASQEARHVELCAHVVRALGSEPAIPEIDVPRLPERDEAFEQAMVELLIAGFAVAETMSVGGFVAARRVTHEPLMRWAFTEILRDEVGHGAFGEEAGAWAMRGFGADLRRALWPVCVAAMQAFERRTGGPVGEQKSATENAPHVSLGAVPGRVTGSGALRAVPRWVLPRLARLGVLPRAMPSS